MLNEAAYLDARLFWCVPINVTFFAQCVFWEIYAKHSNHQFYLGSTRIYQVRPRTERAFVINGIIWICPRGMLLNKTLQTHTIMCMLVARVGKPYFFPLKILSSFWVCLHAICLVSQYWIAQGRPTPIMHRMYSCLPTAWWVTTFTSYYIRTSKAQWLIWCAVLWPAIAGTSILSTNEVVLCSKAGIKHLVLRMMHTYNI